MEVATPPPLESHLTRFQLESFRPGQRDVISAILDGQNCLCIMPTGGGKSLCYQLPSVAREGLTLVVSPLIALMKDQVDSLHGTGHRRHVHQQLALAGRGVSADRRHGGRPVRPRLYRAGAAPQLGVSRKAPTRRRCNCWPSTKPIASASGGTIFGPTMPGSAACGNGSISRKRLPSPRRPRRMSGRHRRPVAARRAATSSSPASRGPICISRCSRFSASQTATGR